ncbi:hypothetical protein GCM10009819_30220 [Agromyces tropicus]|uniref:Cell division protein FtsK n=1 Tax=Agromyces tropicus TaxID=555371 RepID=A0ABN2USF2_9MICO
MPDTPLARTLAPIPDAGLSTLPGAAVLQRVRRLLKWALGAGLAYSVIGGAGKGSCVGGIGGDGGFVDAVGRPTEVAPLCVSVTLEPGGIVYVAIALIVITTLTRVLRHAPDQADAIRRLDRAVVGIIVLVVAWTAITQASFAGISLDGWDGRGPFSFDGVRVGSIVVDVSPMEG